MGRVHGEEKEEMMQQHVWLSGCGYDNSSEYAWFTNYVKHAGFFDRVEGSKMITPLDVDSVKLQVF